MFLKFWGPFIADRAHINAFDVPGTRHQTSSRAKNYWKLENNDHVHLQTPLHPSAAKKFHTNKKECSQDAGVTTTQYIYSTTIRYTHVSIRNLPNSVNFSPLFLRISRHTKIKHSGSTLAAEDSLSLSPRHMWTSRNEPAPEQAFSERTNATVTLSTRENKKYEHATPIFVVIKSSERIRR